MIEVEKKYEVTNEQFAEVFDKVILIGDHLATETLTDLIFNIDRVEQGYNFDRIRLKNINVDQIEFERKSWIGDNRVEIPIECEVVEKKRMTYDLGSYKIMLDRFIDRYFIEIEMLTDNPEEVPNLEDKIIKIAKELIDGELIKAPSYLSMVLDNHELVEDILG